MHSFGLEMYTYMYPSASSPKPTAFLKLRSSKVIRFSEKMFVGKYPRIILRQTEVSVHIYQLPRKRNLLFVRIVISAPFPRQRMDVVHSATLVHACHTSFHLAVPRFFYFVVTCNAAQSVGILPVSAIQNFVAFTF